LSEWQLPTRGSDETNTDLFVSLATQPRIAQRGVSSLLTGQDNSSNRLDGVCGSRLQTLVRCAAHGMGNDAEVITRESENLSHQLGRTHKIARHYAHCGRAFTF
jgi:hypothetical protein